MKKPMKDMIILLPGIMGSVLQHDGSDIWAISGRSIFNFIRSWGGNVENLKLPGDDYGVADLGDDVVSTALMPDTTIIPGFWKIDGYTKISRMIQSKFDVTKGEYKIIRSNTDSKKFEIEITDPGNYFEFHYDWRRDNRVAAKYLQLLIEKQLPIWRDKTGNQSAKVILIAHSMGGLISRHYLEVEGGWQDCHMLITFGTPYRGSLKALDFLSNGYKNRLVDLTDILRSFTSIYQLLPVYKSVFVNGNYGRITDIDNLPNVNQDRANKAREFHVLIKDAVDTNKNYQDYQENFGIIPIVGNKQSTLQSGKLISVDGQDKLEIGSELPDSNLPKTGDGTVSLTSSIPFEKKVREVRPFIEQHGSLQNNSRVLDEVEFLLDTMKSNEALIQAFGPDEKLGINLEPEDLYLADEPIEMSAQIIGTPTIFPDKLNAKIENIDNQEIFSETFLPKPGKWQLERNPLPIGRYRIKVESNNSESKILPVNGLFEVSD